MGSLGSTTILDTLRASDIHSRPCTWGMWKEPIGWGAYEQLLDAYPTIAKVTHGRPYEQNARYDIDAVFLLERPDIDPRMKDFIRAHVSQKFWLQIVEKLGGRIRAKYPDLEDRVGKPLEDFTVGIRNQKREEPVDVEMDAKPGYNTPPTELSTVRGPHVDNPHELFAALMYLRDPDDQSFGGDFVVDTAIHRQDKWRWHGKAEIYPNHFVDHAKVDYTQNVACFFLNSLEAVHHVTPREPSPYPRRLMNFIAEVRKPLFAIPKKRFRTPNAIHKNPTQNVQRRKPEAAT